MKACSKHLRSCCGDCLDKLKGDNYEVIIFTDFLNNCYIDYCISSACNGIVSKCYHNQSRLCSV